MDLFWKRSGLRSCRLPKTLSEIRGGAGGGTRTRTSFFFGNISINTNVFNINDTLDTRKRYAVALMPFSGRGIGAFRH